MAIAVPWLVFIYETETIVSLSCIVALRAVWQIRNSFHCCKKSQHLFGGQSHWHLSQLITYYFILITYWVLLIITHCYLLLIRLPALQEELRIGRNRESQMKQLKKQLEQLQEEHHSQLNEFGPASRAMQERIANLNQRIAELEEDLAQARVRFTLDLHIYIVHLTSCWVSQTQCLGLQQAIRLTVTGSSLSRKSW